MCSQPLAGEGTKSGVSAWDLKPNQLYSQSIFKIHYTDASGGVSFRMVMRISSSDRFEMSISDTFGRKLWDIEFESETVKLLDHKRHQYCTSYERDILSFLALEPLGVEKLPLILFGRLPTRPKIDIELSLLGQTFHDTSGRKWSIRGEGDAPSAWALWGAERPEIWWTRHGKVGILSRRDGTQIRWENASVEALAVPLKGLNVPDTYQRRACDEADLSQLREDQLASPGSWPER